MDETRPVIDVRGLTKRLGDSQYAVQDLTLSMRGGEIYCLLGGTGAGKSTTMRMLLGLIAPTAGHAQLAGYEPWVAPLEVRRRTTFITGRGALCGAMTARQNLRFLVQTADTSRRWQEADGRNALRTMGVPERDFERRVKDLPRHIVMALWLAVGWLRATPILLLEEPTAGLDPRAGARIQRHLWRFRERGQAVFVTTTDILFASQIADRIGILKQGRLVAERTRADVLSLSLTELYFDYVGQPPRRTSLEHPHAPRRLGG